MASFRFNQKQIDKFSDKIDNCLHNPECRRIFETYLLKAEKHNFIRALKLWEKAYGSVTFDDDFYELIDEIDGFNDNPLLSIAEASQKLDYIKLECSNILARHDTHHKFIQYLIKNHM